MTKRLKNRIRGIKFDVVALTVLVLIAFASGCILSGAYKFTVDRLDSKTREIELAQQRALLPWKIASKKAWEGIKIFSIVGVFVLMFYAFYRTLQVALEWFDMKSRMIKPENGIFPIINLGNFALYDPNRDNAGAHPLIALSALDVQKQAALKADNLTVKQTENTLPQSEQNMLTQESLPNMIELDKICKNPSLNNLIVGKSQNEVLTASIHDLMHTLAVGASGWGKSIFLLQLIYQFAKAQENLEVCLIDINGSAFNALQNWNRLRYPIARTTEDSIAVLSGVQQEIYRRKELYEQYPLAHNLQSYNKQSNENLSPIVTVVDEGTNLLNQDDIGDYLRETAQTARQYGVYLLLAGQNAKHSVIDTQTRDNFSTRICFHTSPTSQRVVLGQKVGNVKNKGRAWAQLTGKEVQEIQVPYVSREQVYNAIQQGEPMQSLSAPKDNSEDKLVRELHEQGLSLNEIQERIYGYTGGAAYRSVKRILT
jgi:hypothetical protein